MQRNKKKKKQCDDHRVVREPPFLPLVRVLLLDLLFILFFSLEEKKTKEPKKSTTKPTTSATNTKISEDKCASKRKPRAKKRAPGEISTLLGQIVRSLVNGCQSEVGMLLSKA